MFGFTTKLYIDTLEGHIYHLSLCCRQQFGSRDDIIVRYLLLPDRAVESSAHSSIADFSGLIIDRKEIHNKGITMLSSSNPVH